MFKKMKEDFDKFCKKINEMFGKVYSKMREPKKEKLTLEDIDKYLDNDYKFIDIIEVPYKDRTYDAELWWNNKDGWYRAKTLPSEAQRFDDLKATIIVECSVRSRKKVEQMIIKRIDEERKMVGNYLHRDEKLVKGFKAKMNKRFGKERKQK